MKILVADDYELMRLLIQRILSKMGHMVDAVADGIALVEAWKYRGYSVIVSDVEMPRKNVFEACLEIRRKDREIKIVFVTSLPGLFDVCELQKVGICVKKETLVEDLTRICSRRK